MTTPNNKTIEKILHDEEVMDIAKMAKAISTKNMRQSKLNRPKDKSLVGWDKLKQRARDEEEFRLKLAKALGKK